MMWRQVPKVPLKILRHRVLVTCQCKIFLARGSPEYLTLFEDYRSALEAYSIRFYLREFLHDLGKRQAFDQLPRCAQSQCNSLWEFLLLAASKCSTLLDDQLNGQIFEVRLVAYPQGEYSGREHSGEYDDVPLPWEELT